MNTRTKLPINYFGWLLNFIPRIERIESGRMRTFPLRANSQYGNLASYGGPGRAGSRSFVRGGQGEFAAAPPPNTI